MHDLDKFQLETILGAMADKVENLNDRLTIQNQALDRERELYSDLEDKVRCSMFSSCCLTAALDRANKLPPIQQGATTIDTAHVLWTRGQSYKLEQAVRDLLVCFSNDRKAQTQRIAMIKQVRIITGLGLKEAKDVVDSVVPYNPNV